MKINNQVILINSISQKVNSKTNLPYEAISFTSLPDGSVFNTLVRDENMFGMLRAMNKYQCNFTLSSSQYGLSITINEVLKDLGNILDVE